MMTLNGERSVRIHSLDKKDFVFVVHCHHDEELGMTTVQIRPKRILFAHEFVWVTCGSGVPHLCRFLDIRHSFRNDMTGDVHVEHQIAILKLDLANGAAFHEFVSCDRVARAHLPDHMRGLHGRVIGLISMVVEGRGSIVKVWTARVIFGIEMDLGAMKTALKRLSRLGVPLGIMFAVLGVVD